MNIPIIHEIGLALRNLNSNDVRAIAERRLVLGILALDEAVCERMLTFLLPVGTSDAKRREAAGHLLRIASEEHFHHCEVGLSEPGLPHPEHFYPFDPYTPSRSIAALLENQEDLWLPLGRCFPGLRDAVNEKIIWKISKENTLFTVATAVPNLVPSWITVPWAVGEFASDTAFLTMNQVRMAFLIAAASDAEIGYQAQKAQIGSIIAAAFGWRALAREAVSKVPLGGGLVSKGLISFAGTYVVGKSLERFLRIGRGLTRQEKREVYSQAYERGRTVVEQIVNRVRGRVAFAKSA